jgi:hypothetical protein
VAIIPGPEPARPVALPTAADASIGPDRPRDRAVDLSRALVPLAVVAVALAAGGPLLQGQMVTGHDALEHAIRTAEFARALRAGIWWPEWAPNLGHGYGEPIFLFNPPLFYALAAIPVLVGAPVVSAMNLATMLLLVVGALGVFAWTARTFDRTAALVAATAYAWAPYVLLDVYVRQALTELTALCVLPWVLWGLARTCQAPGRIRLAQAAVSTALLLLSSTPAAVMVLPALLGQLAALGRWRRPGGLARGLAALALGLLLAATFWVPAAAERDLLRFDRLLTGAPAYTNHFVEPAQLVSSAWGYGVSVPGPGDRMGFGLGEANLALAACGLGLLALGRARGLVRRQAWLAIGLVGLGAALATELAAPVWERIPELQYLQFPWRFLVLPTLGCAMLAALPTALLAHRRPRAAILLALLSVTLILLSGWERARPSGLAVMADDAFTAAAVAARDRGRGTAYEYETIWAEGRPDDSPDGRLVARSGAATVVELAETPHLERFSVDARSRVRLRLNTFYFPGWRVYVDGEARSIDYSNPSGLVEFTVERGDHLVEARFEPTTARWIGRLLSGLGFVALLLILLWRRPPIPGGRVATLAPSG